MTNSLKAIQSVFDSPARKLNYKPPYQRNYVWPDSKATYLVESILLHGEIPPIVVYMVQDTWEVIDGRQRCETIDRFLKDEFRLHPHGLDKLWNLAGKKYSELDQPLKDRILDTQLRFIMISPKNEKDMDREKEEWIKREFFRRSNMGISPLNKEEVFKAQYLQDKINVYFKKCFAQDVSTYEQVTYIFDHRSRNLETMMQHIRQLLVLHNIPINRFVRDRDDIVNKYYDCFSYETIDKENGEDIPSLFDGFVKKLHFLTKMKALLNGENVHANGLVYECLYWALSVCEKENVSIERISNAVFQDRLVKHLGKNIHYYALDKNMYSQQVKERYASISSFFESQLNISFDEYLKSDNEFLINYNKKMDLYMKTRHAQTEEQPTKAVATSSSIGYLLNKMKRGKFELRPPYQRDEVVDIRKASALIESILLGVKINPISVYLRDDEVCELIDGQQRLLTIIGFIGEAYRDQHGEFKPSRKNRFALKLKSELLPEIDGKRFDQLSQFFQERIMEYDIDIIEIKQSENKTFKPEELFKRLNHKPFPIKENSFEYWNAYVDSDIIGAIKDIYERNSWLSLRKFDRRMQNQEMITCLCYLNYMIPPDMMEMKSIREVLKICKSRHHPVVKIGGNGKGHIKLVLENRAFKSGLLLSFNSFETDFVRKLKILISSSTGKTTELSMSRRLDVILQTGNTRAAMNFYMLWLILKGIPIEFIKEEQSAVRSRISKIFAKVRTSSTPEELEGYIIDTWALSVVEGV
ncbi:DUF262 domain-containing protein [Chitinophaga sp. SYP-B3965]|uniref:DUF262 domain-containing protein n=1 Tax=Chitinophaga sp. SYP-B3965 TaxID=2663120 RepID=UPI0015640523|nr:DUF262 domain-containing protein [Chitinophaga sp. SYP-B3965]